jgi:hypothetical protein
VRQYLESRDDVCQAIRRVLDVEPGLMLEEAIEVVQHFRRQFDPRHGVDVNAAGCAR